MGNSTEQPTDDARKLSTVSRRARTRGYIEDFGAGRVCRTTGCSVVLSRYNSGGLCWTHEESKRVARSAE